MSFDITNPAISTSEMNNNFMLHILSHHNKTVMYKYIFIFQILNKSSLCLEPVCEDTEQFCHTDLTHRDSADREVNVLKKKQNNQKVPIRVLLKYWIDNQCW